MTLKHLRIFITVCQLESMTLAAEKLNMAQPAVSTAIKELEVFYHTQLFERMNRRIYITEAGQKLLNYASNVFSQLEEAEKTLREPNLLSNIRIGANLSLGTLLLPKLLQHFTQKYPFVKPQCLIDRSHVIEEKLLKNQLDLALVDNLSLSPAFKSQFLFKEEVIAVCSSSYLKKLPQSPYTLEQILKENLLLREKGSGLRNCVDQGFNQIGFFPKPLIESVSTTVLIEAALHNLGILFVEEKLIKPYLNTHELCKIKLMGTPFNRYYYLLYHEQKHLTPIMQHFITCLMQNLPNEQKK